MENLCQCPFCEFRRSIDPAEVITSAAEDQDYYAKLESTLVNPKDPGIARAAVSAAMLDIMPLTMDAQARFTTGQSIGKPFELLEEDQVDHLFKMVFSLVIMIQATGIADLAAGEALRQRVASFHKEGQLGSIKLQ